MSDFEKQKNLNQTSSASPKTRKFARELGVDINNITGSQRSGRIIEEDIKKFVSFLFFDLNSTIKNYYHVLHIVPLVVISIASFFGTIISINHSKNLNLIIALYLFSTKKIIFSNSYNDFLIKLSVETLIVFNKGSG